MGGKRRKLSNAQLVQKVQKFMDKIFSNDDNTESEWLALAHFFHSFCPTKREIAFARQFTFPDASISEIPENVEDKLKEVRSKLVYGLMSTYSMNRTTATEAFNLWWYQRSNNIPEDVKKIINDFWKEYQS